MGIMDEGADGSFGGDGLNDRETLHLQQRIVDELGPTLYQGWTRLDAAFSQLGRQSETRLVTFYQGGYVARGPLPHRVMELFIELRRVRRGSEGSFASVFMQWVHGQVPQWYFNHDRRPFWNSPTDDLLTPPQVEPLPELVRWRRDFEELGETVPQWLVEQPVGVEMARLAEALQAADVPAGWVELALDAAGASSESAQSVLKSPYARGPWCEGRLTLKRVGPDFYTVEISDYGAVRELGDYREEKEAALALWNYLTSARPPAYHLPMAELQRLMASAAPSFDDLAHRLLNLGPGGLITSLATGVAYDHFGGQDGLYLYPWGTPLPLRSLPQTALQAPGAAHQVYLANRGVDVQAEITAPWFDQPGGGLRFRLAGGSIRDAVNAGVLTPVVVSG